MKKNQFLTAILWCLLKFIYSKDSLINVLKGGVVWVPKLLLFESLL
jgi:hypothetical protein